MYEHKGAEEKSKKVPFDISVLLEHLGNAHKRSALLDTIEQRHTQSATFRDA